MTLFRRDDLVLVIAGNDKGKTGKILLNKGDRVVVQGVNLRKKHVKRTQQAQTAQILEIEMPIAISNIRHCTTEGTPVRMRVKQNKKNGSKELVYKEKGKEVVYRLIKQPAK